MRLALACLVLLQAAAANAHVYGIDRRAQRDADVLPYRAVGMLVDPHTGNGGTAFLVGRCHVVSAHHVPYDAGARQDAANPPGLGRQVRFLVGPRPGKARVFASSTTATVVDAGRFVQDDFAGAAGDWAILRLDNCLGDRYGWLRVDRDTTPESLPGTTLTSVGYPRSRSRQPGVTIESGCRARDFGPVPGIFGVDCGFEIGMSGGPLLVRHPKGHAARGRRDLAVAGRGYADGVLDGEPQPGGACLGIPPGAGPRSQSGGAARRAGGKPALIERRRHCANRGLPDVAARSPARSRRAGRDGRPCQRFPRAPTLADRPRAKL